jgi:hypothetical protein
VVDSVVLSQHLRVAVTHLLLSESQRSSQASVPVLPEPVGQTYWLLPVPHTRSSANTVATWSEVIPATKRTIVFILFVFILFLFLDVSAA